MDKYQFTCGHHGYRIPGYMRDGLDYYINRGHRPGDFLNAVLENNLVRACAHADGQNMPNLPAYANFLYNYAPADCWGSPEKVTAWEKMGGLEGLREKRKKAAAFLNEQQAKHDEREKGEENV